VQLLISVNPQSFLKEDGMAAFTITPAGKGIMRCRHTGAFSPEDVQWLAKFLEDYKGKLLIDLTGTKAEDL
jgi:hypothetical protein